MWKNALWFWPLLAVIPTALAVVIGTNSSARGQPTWLHFLALGLFSYTFYYFALSWPVWLSSLTRGKRTVISSLVPVAVLLLLAVLPLRRELDALTLKVSLPSFTLWFTPGVIIHQALKGAVWTSACRIPLWEASQHGLQASISQLEFLPDGRILVSGAISKPGGSMQGGKLSRLLPNGSADPSFQGHTRCFDIEERHPGRLWPQPDGRLVLSTYSVDSTPYGPTELLLLISPDGEELRRVSLPQLPPERLVWGRLAGLQLEPDGGFLAYGSFSGKRTPFRSFTLRVSAEGQPDLRSSVKLPGLESHHAAPPKRAPDGRLFTLFETPVEDSGPLKLGLFALGANGRPDGAFQEQAQATQKKHGLGQVRALALQADGKLVAAFEKKPRTVELARLHPDGTLDTSFQRTELPLDANHVSALTDGGILVARVQTLSNTASPAGMELVRLSPDGRLDEAVTARIKATLTSRGVTDIHALAVKPDGTVLLYRPLRAGALGTSRRLVQLRPDGSADTGFRPPF